LWTRTRTHLRRKGKGGGKQIATGGKMMTRTAERLHSQQKKTGLGRMIPTTLSEETKTESPSGGHGVICKRLASSVFSIPDADAPPRLNGQLRITETKGLISTKTRKVMESARRHPYGASGHTSQVQRQRNSRQKRYRSYFYPKRYSMDPWILN